MHNHASPDMLNPSNFTIGTMVFCLDGATPLGSTAGEQVAVKQAMEV